MPTPRLPSLSSQLWLFLACCACEGLARRLALPPMGIAALDPVAGIALACMLRWGWWCAPALALSTIAERLWSAPVPGPSALGIGAVMALATVCQAGLGAWLVRPGPGDEPALNEPRDIARFMALGGFAASAVGAAAGVLVTSTAGAASAGTLAFNALTWWLGQALSICSIAPIALSVLGRPAAEWHGRRVTLGLPLVVGLVFLGAMIAGVLATDQRRIRASFDRESSTALSILTLELLEPQRALEAMRSVFTASAAISRDGLRVAALPWLQGPGHLQSLGFEERATLSGIPALEARVRADGVPGFTVFDRNDENTSRSAPVDTVYAITYMEPAARGASRLGLNSRSIAAAREAIDTTARTGAPIATRRFTLTQGPNAAAQSGIVTYQAVYAGEPKTDAERLAAVRGVVLTTVRLDETLNAVLGRLPKSLSICIVDATPGSPRERLAGAPGCEDEKLALSRLEPIAYAGRQWELRLNANDLDLPGSRGGNAWSFAVAGMLALSLLAMLLLTVTGRARRIELAIEEARAARAAADAANGAKREFLANMSHEIRTPMNAILGMSHLALRSGLAPRQHDYVLKIERSARSLLGVINDILDFSKVEAGKLEVESVPFRLGDVLENLATLIGPRAQEKGLELAFSIQPGIPAGIVGDPLRLTQVLVNLATNAVKFTERGSVRVSVESRTSADGALRLRFAVSDTGIGIDPVQRERLFQAFEQAESSTSRRFGGTGLGLAISGQLVRLMGGEITLASAPGQGSEFAFELSFGVSPDTGQETASHPGPSGRPTPVDGRDGAHRAAGLGVPAVDPPSSAASHRAGLQGARILLVEDNDINAELASELLQDAGAKVTWAPDGLQAIEALARERFDAVLMDCQMPLMDGYEATRAIRARAGLHDGPIIAMTANAFAGDREKALAAGMDDHIAKPIDVAEMFATLARWVAVA